MNIIIVSMDTFRRDRIEVFGSRRRLTPNLDKLASESVLFSNAFANDIPTQPAHSSIMTGRYGINNGVMSHFAMHEQLSSSAVWLPRLLQKQGFQTAAVDHLFLMRDWFASGYDDYISPNGRSRAPAADITGLGLDWLRGVDKRRPFFLFLHYWDPHVPYIPPKPYADHFVRWSSLIEDSDALPQIRNLPTFPLHKTTLYDHLGSIPSLAYIADLYDAEIAYLDADLGRLIGFLEEEEFFSNGILIVLADHGENMAEHDAWFDHSGLYDSVIRIPLFFYGPEMFGARTVEAFVQHIDIMPTVLDILELDSPRNIDGQSLMPLLTARTSITRDHVIVSEGTWAAKRAIRNTHWKYIECYDPGPFDTTTNELYDLTTDRFETNNVLEGYPRIAQSLQDQLNDWIAAQLEGRIDPMIHLIRAGLPGVHRLKDVIRNTQDHRIP